jgi:hypothetical protein
MPLSDADLPMRSKLSSVTTRSCGSPSLRMRYCGEVPFVGSVPVT